LALKIWENETRKRKTETSSAGKELVRSYVRSFALGQRKFWGPIRMLLNSTIPILMGGKGIPAGVENNMK